MAKLRNSAGVVLELIGGFSRGYTGEKDRQAQREQEQQRIDLARRRVEMDEAYMRGRQEEREKLEGYERSLLEMDYLASEGLANKDLIKGRAAGQAGMAVAGMALGGQTGAMRNLDPAMQKAAADVSRWNEAFRGMDPKARGALLSDMAVVRDEMEAQRQFKRHKGLLQQKIQALRGTSGQLEDVDPALERVFQGVSEAETPQELVQYDDLLNDLVAESDQRTANLKASETFTGWYGAQEDRNNVGPVLANAVARGEMTPDQAMGKFLAMNKPEVFRASREEVIRKEAREHAQRLRERAIEKTIEVYGQPFSEEDRNLFNQRVREMTQFLGGGVPAPRRDVPPGGGGEGKGDGPTVESLGGPKKAAALFQAFKAKGLSLPEALQAIQAGMKPEDIPDRPKADPVPDQASAGDAEEKATKAALEWIPG